MTKPHATELTLAMAEEDPKLMELLKQPMTIMTIHGQAVAEALGVKNVAEFIVRNTDEIYSVASQVCGRASTMVYKGMTSRIHPLQMQTKLSDRLVAKLGITVDPSMVFPDPEPDRKPREIVLTQQKLLENIQWCKSNLQMLDDQLRKVAWSVDENSETVTEWNSAYR